MAKRQRDPRKEAFWRRTVARWQKSGQTIRAFCHSAGLAEPSFYAWRAELQRRDRTAPLAEDAPVFVPVQVIAEPASAAPPAPLELVTAVGHVIRVRSGFDAATLRQLLAALTEAPSC